jgi:hypothetical protein
MPYCINFKEIPD